jgi:hypothetical protein
LAQLKVAVIQFMAEKHNDVSWLPDGLLSVQNIFYLNPEQYRTWLGLNTHMADDFRKNIPHNFVCIIIE